MKKIILILIVITLSILSVYGQSKKENKQQKTEEQYENIKKLIVSKKYDFHANWISTNRGRRVDINAGSNILTIDQDTARAYMQFFGEVNSIRFSGGQGVEFNNKLIDYKVEYKDDKKKIYVSFVVKDESETYNISMMITGSGYAYVDLYSNIKRNVTYDGQVTPIKNENK